MLVGELYWADLPASSGREQAGRRPVMVLQDEALAYSLPTALIIPLTSVLAAQRFPGTVVVKATAKNGLAYDSVILTFQIRALDRSRFHARIGVVEATILAQVYFALDQLTGHP